MTGVSAVKPVAAFTDLRLEVGDPTVVGPFWADVLGRDWHEQPGGHGYLEGPTPAHTIRVVPSSEPKSVKHRVHLDVYARTLVDLYDLGATLVLAEGDDRRWTVMADPDGGEFCAFVRDDVPAERLHGLVVDSAYPYDLAAWWGAVLGREPTWDERGFATLSDLPGFPIETMDFVPVPEPKTTANRVRMTLTGHAHDLVTRGAALLSTADDEVAWDVLADPEGNEFCLLSGDR